MELDTTASTILCCLCGTRIQANTANMCGDCLRGQVDLSEEIVTQGQVLIMCKQCHRWQTKSKQVMMMVVMVMVMMIVMLLIDDDDGGDDDCNAYDDDDDGSGGGDDDDDDDDVVGDGG